MATFWGQKNMIKIDRMGKKSLNIISLICRLELSVLMTTLR